MNYAKQIAEMLGLEIGEKFQIEGHPNMGTFWFIEDGSIGLRDIWEYEEGSECYDVFENCNDLLEQLLTGFYEVKKFPWKPQIGDLYAGYDIYDDCCFEKRWYCSAIDLSMWNIGNCFKTREEAEIKGKEIMKQFKEEYEKE